MIFSLFLFLLWVIFNIIDYVKVLFLLWSYYLLKGECWRLFKIRWLLVINFFIVVIYSINWFRNLVVNGIIIYWIKLEL